MQKKNEWVCVYKDLYDDKIRYLWAVDEVWTIRRTVRNKSRWEYFITLYLKYIAVKIFLAKQNLIFNLYLYLDAALYKTLIRHIRVNSNWLCRTPKQHYTIIIWLIHVTFTTHWIQMMSVLLTGEVLLWKQQLWDPPKRGGLNRNHLANRCLPLTKLIEPKYWILEFESVGFVFILFMCQKTAAGWTNVK